MRRVVVTGGAGFIGSHLADALVRRGYRVAILDNLSTGKKQNIEPLLNHSSVDFIEDSITNLPLLQKLLRGTTYVFHQAALVRVSQSIDDPLSTNEANINGTLNILMASKENAVEKVVYASSAAIYGDATESPQKENTLPNPLNPYAVSKMAAESYCEIFRQIYGLSTVSLRYFNIYGPRQDPLSKYATVIASFLNRISQNLPPIIFGDGEQSRDLIFVEDVVQANILAAEGNSEGVFNIGSGRSTTINQLATLLLKLTGKNLKPVYQEPRLGDPRQSLADISRARSFGYEPEFSLEKGLKRTIEVFRVSTHPEK